MAAEPGLVDFNNDIDDGDEDDDGDDDTEDIVVAGNDDLWFKLSSVSVVNTAEVWLLPSISSLSNEDFPFDVSANF